MPPRIDSSRRSPTSLAKADPYANKTHRRIDIVLVVITLLLMVFAFRLSAQHRQSPAEPTRTAQQTAQK